MKLYLTDDNFPTVEITLYRQDGTYCLAQVDNLWEEVTRFENPHSYYVDLSQKLWDEKNRLLSEKTY